MLKCGICGCEFNATIEKHYISREKGKVGLAAILAAMKLLNMIRSIARSVDVSL